MSNATEFKLPDLAEGMTEGEIVTWHVAVGDAVTEDTPVLEVMTDKATVTIGAPRSGSVRELRFKVGDMAKVGDVLFVIGPQDPDLRHSQVGDAPLVASQGPAATAVGELRDVLPGAGYFQRGDAAKRASLEREPTGRTVPASGYFEAKPQATPAVRALAKELGVDLRTVPPTGPLGRVQESDVRKQAPSATMHRASAPAVVEPGEFRQPFVGVRRRIAERLEAAVRSAVHFTFVEELDVGPLLARREQLLPEAEAAGVNLTYLAFIVQSVTRALAAYPLLNSYLDSSRNELVTRSATHIGMAVATDAGLMVPVIRHAEHLNLLAIGREIERLGLGARNGTLRADELSGSTFTVSSLGKLGGLLATPVLNYPEVGILGVHRIKDKPVIRDGAVVPGKLMMMSFSFDHRIIDGHVGASFAYAVLDALEHPESLA